MSKTRSARYRVEHLIKDLVRSNSQLKTGTADVALAEGLPLRAERILSEIAHGTIRVEHVELEEHEEIEDEFGLS